MRKLIVILFCLIGMECFSQHNPTTDQYLLNPLPLNPAFAGSKEILSTGLSIRRQWTGIDNAPVTFTLNGHNRIPNTRLGYGLLLLNEEVAISKRTGVLANFSYHLKTGSGNFSFGLAAGFENYRNEWSAIQTVTEEDPTFNLQNESHWRPNFSAGIYYHNEESFISFSIPLMLSNQYQVGIHETFQSRSNPEEFNYHLLAGYRFKFSDLIEIRPSVMAKYIYSSPLQLDLNLQAFYKESFGLGFIYRPNQSVSSILRYNVNEMFSLGYSVEFSINELAGYQNGSHEISMRFDLIKITNSKSTSVF